MNNTLGNLIPLFFKTMTKFLILFLPLFFLLTGCDRPQRTYKPERPNILFIAVDDLNDWTESVYSRLPQQEVLFSCEVKIDGVAISIVYNRGRFERAVTRGNGETGDDVTSNARTIQSLPLHLQRDVSLQLRGEIFLPIERFRIMNEKKERGIARSFSAASCEVVSWRSSHAV